MNDYEKRVRLEQLYDKLAAQMVNRLKVRPKMSVDSPCVEPSPKFFRGRRFDTTSTL
jgi:hypothetical protein